MRKKEKQPSDFKYTWLELIDSFVDPENPHLWQKCPRCKLRPKIWTFDNGRFAACGCHNTMYDHFTVQAESIASVVKRTGGFIGYNSDDLRKNWNYFVSTGKHKFLPTLSKW